MSQLDISAFFEGYWKVVCAKVRRPLSGIRLPDELVVREATAVFEEFLGAYDSLPPRGEIGKFFTGRALRRSLEATAAARKEAGDAQLYHNPDEQFYESNLDLDELQKRTADGSFESSEWGGLPGVLWHATTSQHRESAPLQDAGQPSPFGALEAPVSGAFL